MCILIFPSKIWAKKCTLCVANYGSKPFHSLTFLLTNACFGKMWNKTGKSKCSVVGSNLSVPLQPMGLGTLLNPLKIHF